MFFKGDFTLSVVNSAFSLNSADVNGGAIFAEDLREVAIAECFFSNNIAKTAGGSIAILTGFDQGTPCSFTTCNFTMNTAGLGAGVYVATREIADVISIAAHASFEDCYFGKNFAGTSGGAISSLSELTVVTCRLYGNGADRGKGGAIWHAEYEMLYVVVAQRSLFRGVQ